jgi:hypothetical protein
MTRLRTFAGALIGAAVIALLAPTPAMAQIRQVSSGSSDGNQTINFNIGYFALKGLDSRVTDDVLLNELQTEEPLLFEVKDFNSASIGGEYLIGFGGMFEGGVGIGFTQRTVPSVYANLQHADGSEIEQDLKLRTIPVTFTARFLPLGHGSIEPYVGAGIAAIRWRYSEVGEFVDFDRTIFAARYIGNGTAAGPTVLGGIRGVVGHWAVGGEIRWQNAEATGLLNDGFVGDKLDLGGWTTNFTIGMRF